MLDFVQTTTDSHMVSYFRICLEAFPAFFSQHWPWFEGSKTWALNVQQSCNTPQSIPHRSIACWYRFRGVPCVETTFDNGLIHPLSSQVMSAPSVERNQSASRHIFPGKDPPLKSTERETDLDRKLPLSSALVCFWGLNLGKLKPIHAKHCVGLLH